MGGGFPNTAGDIPEGGIRPLLIALQATAWQSRGNHVAITLQSHGNHIAITASNHIATMASNHTAITSQSRPHPPSAARSQEVSARVGKTPSQVSLNWIMCKGAIPLPGASSAQQVRENAGALGWRLSDEDVAVLDGAADSLPFEFRGSGFQTADSKFVGYGFERWKLD